ncbi:MAG TPA: hypothetical protein VMP68_18295 [Candidatus Eisenbacteria bacterium]|nr:hypothetical protein [Candidatus Eisenbacteria bacterium]
MDTTVAVIVAVLGLFVYAICAFVNGKKLAPDKHFFSFGLWCGAFVTGAYMVLSALHVLRVDEERYRIYVGIFGVVLMFWSFQTVYDMLRAVIGRKQSPSKTISETPGAAAVEKQFKE